MSSSGTRPCAASTTRNRLRNAPRASNHAPRASNHALQPVPCPPARTQPPSHGDGSVPQPPQSGHARPLIRPGLPSRQVHARVHPASCGHVCCDVRHDADVRQPIGDERQEPTGVLLEGRSSGAISEPPGDRAERRTRREDEADTNGDGTPVAHANVSRSTRSRTSCSSSMTTYARRTGCPRRFAITTPYWARALACSRRSSSTHPAQS